MKTTELDNKIVAVVGLGYVGLPIALAFSSICKVIGFDINEEKINSYKKGIDPTYEVEEEEFVNANIEFTNNAESLSKADYIIVAVPTPLDTHDNPNLTPLEMASKTIGINMKKGAIIIYESTVYPGVTEEICIPILELTSGKKCGSDFKVGYSPERINPGDKSNKLENIMKIVSGQDEETLEAVSELYSYIIKAGIYKAPSIKVAEMSKVMENCQRFINITFMNEMTLIADSLDIDIYEALEAASTKWNFLNFSPGLIGGHCIDVDPFYLLYKAYDLGCCTELLSGAIKTNNNMYKHLGEKIIKNLILNGNTIKNSRVLVLGFTFKENVADTRNTKVFEIVSYLKEYGINVIISDPLANKDEVLEEYNIDIVDYDTVSNVDAIVVAVSHNKYKHLDIKEIKNKYGTDKKILFDIKGTLHRETVEKEGIIYYGL